MTVPRTKSGQLRLEDVPCPACEKTPDDPCLFCMGARRVSLTRAIEFQTRDTDPAPPDDQSPPK